MSAKLVLVSCTVALLAQSAFSQCATGLRGGCGNAGAYGAGLGGYGAGLGGYGAGLGGYGAGLGGYGAGLGGYGSNGAGLGGYGAGLGGSGCGGVASTGGGLPVSSASPNAPVGVSVLSENAYEGNLCAGGNLPFLGTVVIEGLLPTAGAGAVSYGCGNGAVGIANEGPIGTDILGAGSYPPAGPASFAGYGAGIAGFGAGIGGRDSGCGCGCGARYI